MRSSYFFRATEARGRDSGGGVHYEDFEAAHLMQAYTVEVVSMGPVVKRIVVGSCEVAVWQNVVRRGEQDVTLHNVSVKRSYKDREGRVQTMGSLQPQDVPALIVGLGRASTYLLELEAVSAAPVTPSQDGEAGEERGR